MDVIMCLCGSKKPIKIGSVPHVIKGFQIILHDVPHYYCDYCESYSYDLNTDITNHLKYAFLNQLNEISWNATINAEELETLMKEWKEKNARA